MKLDLNFVRLIIFVSFHVSYVHVTYVLYLTAVNFTSAVSPLLLWCCNKVPYTLMLFNTGCPTRYRTRLAGGPLYSGVFGRSGRPKVDFRKINGGGTQSCL